MVSTAKQCRQTQGLISKKKIYVGNQLDVCVVFTVFVFWYLMWFTWHLSSEGNCESSAREGPATWQSFLFNILWLTYKNCDFKNILQYPNFWKSWKLLFSGLMGGWVGDQKYLIFQYVYKYDVLILKIYQQFFVGFFIKSYDHI